MAQTLGEPVTDPGHSAAAEPPADLRDPAAFDAFYRRSLPRLYGFFLHRCGGQVAVAEELTQETFLAAIDALRRDRRLRVDAPLPWLFGIARHKLLDHYRREARGGGATTRSWEAWQADTGSDGGSDTDAPPALVGAPWEEAGWPERTLAALAALPPAQRQALALRYLDDLSVPEVAAALGRGVHAAESLLARARAGFKRAYAEASDD